MFRKIVLAIAALALIGVGFAIYTWRDEDVPSARARFVPPSPPATAPASQPSPGDGSTLSIRGVNVREGDRPVFHYYDPQTGEARIVFEASEWKPLSETEFHVLQPSASVLLPGGQMAYVQADEGRIKVQAGDSKNFNPKQGWFKGHVKIRIDTTRPEWRRQHPELADPDKHPHAVVDISMDDARFDMDLARLESDGHILVESQRGSIEGRGLEMMWSEVTRQVKFLRIMEGHRATVRDEALDEFNILAGDTQLVEEASESSSATAPAEIASAMEPASLVDEQAEPDTEQGIAFLDTDRPVARPRKDRIDTYRIAFNGNVVATQRTGEKVTGSLKADLLTILSDLGQEEREAVEYAPGSRPAGTPRKPGTRPAVAVAASDPSSTAPDKAKESTTIELTWSGEVTLAPDREEQSASQPAAGPTTQPRREKRLHLMAEGRPVEIQDAKQGGGTCLRLEYHAESKRVWLVGNPEHPVHLNTGDDRRIMVERKLFLDYKGGVAELEGRGRMVREQNTTAPDGRPAGLSAESNSILGGDTSQMELAWQDRGYIEFGQTSWETPGTEGGPPIKHRQNYIKQARFEGEVIAGLPDQTVSADQLDVTFTPPSPPTAADAEPKPTRPASTGGDLMDQIIADRILAAGNVRMTQHHAAEPGRRQEDRTDEVTCERLDIEMTVDDAGRNVPKVGHAFGTVIARQVIQPYLGPVPMGKQMTREIRAGESLAIEMASVSRPVGEEERQRLETQARALGYTPESPQWQRVEQKLRNRRQLIITKMIGRGDVAAFDQKQDLNNLAGRSLECAFDSNGRISRAIVEGWPDRPAQVDHDTFFIRGKQLSLEMAEESVSVPGQGILQFYSDQDIDGRPLDKPVPVVVSWEERMWLRGRENTGTFTGSVRVSSENNMMESRELRLRFAPAGPDDTAAGTSPSGPLGGLLANKRSSSSDRNASRIRKKLTYVDALGDAVIVSSAYEDPSTRDETGVAALIKDLIPEQLKAPATQPASAGKQRLLSRLRLAGPQMHIDLLEEQLVVEGTGNLLIEDYRLPEAGGRTPTGSADLLATSALPGMSDLGPSQTLITWANSMTFLNRSRRAVFDHQVNMRHRAGADMVLAGQMEAALKLDEATRSRIKSRASTLSCDNMVVLFDTADDAAPRDSSPLSRATGLKGFWARGNVTLSDREAQSQRYASGTTISYDGDTQLAKITGTTQQPAVIQEVDPKTGRLKAMRRGGDVEWNMKTREIRAIGSDILR